MKTTRAISCLAVGLVLFVGCGKSVMSQREFTRNFAAELESSHPEMQVEIVSDLELRTRVAGSTNSVYLDNAYARYLARPKEAKQIIATWIQSVGEMPDVMDSLRRTNIVPVVKDAAFVQEVTAGMREQGKDTNNMGFVSRPLNSLLTVVYAHDSAHNIRYLQPGDVATLGLASDELHALAVENLERIVPEPQVNEIVKGLYLVSTDGTYEPSLLLRSSWWKTNRFDIKGEIVVAVPRREVLMVCGSDDGEILPRLRILARRYYTEGPYELTDRLFVYRDGTFVLFE